ncbi:ankyrin repeat-containing domain protein [Rostrohypoxylon terebratum]|nr:ankyrin repeat-containing domain protein [Rostrohypoxylon terebratum]
MTENNNTTEEVSDPNMETSQQSPDAVVDPGAQEISNTTASSTERKYLVVDMTTSTNARTPLYEFLQTQTDANYDADKLAELLVNKKDINTPCKSDHKRTPLHIAIWRECIGAVKKLIYAGASVLIEDDDGQHPLHYACLRENPELVCLLLDAGANLEARDYKQQTPLITASLQWSDDLVRCLADAGADTTAVNYRKSTALFYACKYGEMTFAKTILEKSQASINIENDDGLTPLHIAVECEYEEIVIYLLEKGADINKTDNQGRTPLSAAIRQDSIAITRILAGNERVDVNIPDNDGITPLMVACEHGFEDGVNILVEHDVKWNLLSNRGWTALMHACQERHTEITNKYISLEKPEISLHIGSQQGYANIVQALLDAGASIDVIGKEGKTALHYASEADGWSQDPYEKDPEKFNPDSPIIAKNIPQGSDQYCAVLEILLHRNASLKAMTTNGDTALHLSARRDIRRVQLIMKKMQIEDFDIENKEGRTALSVAIEAYEPDTVRVLLGKMENAVLGRYDEQDAIVWATESADRHDIAEMIFKKSKNQLSNKSSEDVESLIQWATYKEMPKALWFVLSTLPPTPDTEEYRKSALNYAEKRVSEIAENKVEPHQTRGRSAGKERKGQKQEDTQKQEATHTQQGTNMTLIRDILLDPPFTQTSRRRGPFKKPGVENKPAEMTQKFEAAIIEFYEGEAGSGFLRRFRSVKDTIYDRGPKAISKEVKTNLGKVFEEKSTVYSKPLEKKWALHEMYIKEDPKLTWIHLPATNMVWMNDLLKRIMWDESQDAQNSEEKETKENEFNEMTSFFGDSWLQVPDRKSPSRSMKPQCVSHGNNEYKAIYMPYLTFSKKLRANPGQDDKIHQDLKKAKDQHRDLLNAYENKVIHGSPTLDESYYHFADDSLSQNDRRYRNKTQVVTKILESDGKEPPFWTVLRVNQLWVWVIRKDLLITATTHPVHKMKDSLLSDIFGYLGRKTEAGESHAQPRTAVDMSKVLIDYCVDLYEGDQMQANRIGQSTRQIYFKAINEIAIKEAKLYEKFSLDKRKDDGSDALSAENVSKAICKAASLSCDIKDILDELNILKTIATHQHTVQAQLNNVLTNSGISKATTAPDLEYSAARIINGIEAMDRAADRIHSAVDTILALEQNETGNVQAKTANTLATEANKQTNESMAQGRTLMTFTIITTIFLPLSFLSSMFALDYEASQKTPGKVYGIIVGVAVGVFLMITVFGLNFQQPAQLGQNVDWSDKDSGFGTPGFESHLQKGDSLATNDSSQTRRVGNSSFWAWIRRGRKLAAELPR